jgi:RNA polymerase sigma-70 factor (ECF subfamily)
MLYEKFSKPMYNVCFRMLGNSEEAKDVLQDSFIAAFRNIGQLTENGAFGGWLRTSVINRCIDLVRKRNYMTLPLELKEMPEEEKFEEPDGDYTIEDIRNAMLQLPDGYRLILTLFLFEEHSHKMIARSLNISEGTSKSQYARGRKKLALLLHQNKMRDGR